MSTTGLLRYWLCLLMFFTLPIQGHTAQEINMNYLANTQPFQAVDLEQIKTSTNPTLVKLWANWSPQCRQELQTTEELATEPDIQGINILTRASPGPLNECPTEQLNTSITGLKY